LKLVSKDVLASGSLDKASRIWNITNGQLIKILTGHLGSIQWSIDFLSNSQTLVSGSLDKTIKTWNIASGQFMNTFNTGLNIRTLTILNSIGRSTSKNRIFSFYSKKNFFDYSLIKFNKILASCSTVTTNSLTTSRTTARSPSKSTTSSYINDSTSNTTTIIETSTAFNEIQLTSATAKFDTSIIQTSKTCLSFAHGDFN
jgi:WD40 repeat protein